MWCPLMVITNAHKNTRTAPVSNRCGIELVMACGHSIRMGLVSTFIGRHARELRAGVLPCPGPLVLALYPQSRLQVVASFFEVGLDAHGLAEVDDRLVE